MSANLMGLLEPRNRIKYLLTLCVAFFGASAALSQSLAFDVTANMPATAGADTCQLYLDGVPAGAPAACDTDVFYDDLIVDAGIYSFRYAAINASGESGLSPIRTVAIDIVPEDPATAPVINVTCDPSPCPDSVTITISL